MAERLSLSEVSRLLNVTPSELRAKCEAGEIPGAERAGGHWFVPTNLVGSIAAKLGVPLLGDLPASVEPPSHEDVRRMEISTASLDGAIPDPYGDSPVSRPPVDGGADVLFGELDEGGEQNDMRTVMGSADDLRRMQDEIELSVRRDPTPAEDTSVLSGDLDVDDTNDQRTVMGSANQFQGEDDEQINLRSDAASGEQSGSFRAPSLTGSIEDDAAVLAGELEARSGDYGTVLGTAAELTTGRESSGEIRLDARSGEVKPAVQLPDDDDAAVLSGELDAASGDMHTMMGGAGQFGLAGGNEPIDLSSRQEEPSSYHEAFGLDEADDEPAPGEGMHTMVGDASQFGFDAEQVRLDLARREGDVPSSIVDGASARATEDSDEVHPTGGGMHTVVGDAASFGFHADEVPIGLSGAGVTSGAGSSINNDAAVLSGDLDASDSGETGTIVGSAAELTGEGSGEVTLDSPTARSDADDAAVLSGDLDSDGGDMGTIVGSASQLTGQTIGLRGEDDDEPSAMDQRFDDPEVDGGEGMHTMVGDVSQLGFDPDQVRLDLASRGEPGGSSMTEEIMLNAAEDSDELMPTGGGMHTVVGDAASFGFDAEQVKLDLAGRGDEVPISGGDSSVNLGGSSIVDDSAAVLSGDLDVDDAGDMRTIMGGPGQFASDEADRINVSSAMDDGSAVLSGDLDAEQGDPGDMKTLMGGIEQLGPDDNVRIAGNEPLESDALVLSGNLDASDSSGNMRTELSGDYGAPIVDETVNVASEQLGDSSDRILIGQEDLGDSSDYSPSSPTILGISPLDSGSGDQVVVGSTDVIDSDIRMNSGGGPRPGESDVRLVPDQTNVDSDIRVSQFDDANDSGGVWAARPHNPSDSQTFDGADAIPTLPEASQDVTETTPGIIPPNAVPEESDLSINMEPPEAGDEMPTATFAPPSAPAPLYSSPVDVSYTPAADDTAELDPRAVEDDQPAASDATPGAFYMDDDVTLAEHTSETDPAPSSSGFPLSDVDADEELTIAEGIDMKPSPDKTSLSMNPGKAPLPARSDEVADEAAENTPGPGDSGLTLGADELLLSGSDVTNEPVQHGINTSVVNLDDSDHGDDFVLGGETGSDITLAPNASGIGIGGGLDSNLGLAGSGVDLEAPVDLGPGSSGITSLDGDNEFLLQPAGGSNIDEADSDSGSQVIALEASSEDPGAYQNPTMLAGDDAFGAPTMLGGDVGAADPYGHGALDPLAPQPGAYAQPGYGAPPPGVQQQVIVVPRVELEYTPLQIASLTIVSLIIIASFLVMLDLAWFNGAEWKGPVLTGGLARSIVETIGY